MDYVTRADDRCVELRGATVPPHPAAALAGLVGRLDDGRALLRTGIVMGPVRIDVQVLTGPPPTVDDEWQDIAELSCRVTQAPVLAAGPYADPPDTHLRLDPANSDWFRLRVHARHRDSAFDLVAHEPVEEYQLISWPAPPAPPLVLAAGSDLARQAIATADATEQPHDFASREADLMDRLRTARHRGDAAPGLIESAEDTARHHAAQANLLRVTRQNER